MTMSIAVCIISQIDRAKVEVEKSSYERIIDNTLSVMNTFPLCIIDNTQSVLNTFHLCIIDDTVSYKHFPFVHH